MRPAHLKEKKKARSAKRSRSRSGGANRSRLQLPRRDARPLTSPCASQTWTHLGEVELPESFFYPEGSAPEPGGFGCCQVGPTCFDGNSPGGCIATRFEWHDGASCDYTDEPCPPEIPLDDCFLGTCR